MAKAVQEQNQNWTEPNPAEWTAADETDRAPQAFSFELVKISSENFVCGSR